MKERGILEFLEASVRLHRENIEFAILGYCDENYQELLNEYEEKGIISQWGFHTEVHPFLAKSSAIVVASFHEGMSTGFGFTPGDADDLIRAMENFLSLSKEGQAAMGKAAREKMEREFDRNMVIDAYMEEVDKICLASIRER